MAKFKFNGSPELFADDVRRYLSARKEFREAVNDCGLGDGVRLSKARLELDEAGKDLLASIVVFGEVVE